MVVPLHLQGLGGVKYTLLDLLSSSSNRSEQSFRYILHLGSSSCPVPDKPPSTWSIQIVWMFTQQQM